MGRKRQTRGLQFYHNSTKMKKIPKNYWTIAGDTDNPSKEIKSRRNIEVSGRVTNPDLYASEKDAIETMKKYIEDNPGYKFTVEKYSLSE